MKFRSKEETEELYETRLKFYGGNPVRNKNLTIGFLISHSSFKQLVVTGTIVVADADVFRWWTAVTLSETDSSVCLFGE